ncbi:acyltransferase family protein [Maribacter dokdonensis]|uniref:acyltransferase family protein n=1 Tax=Maribacter dokdonensis TaxID=320912 RepID=UPI002AB1D317|nr:acyltransferase family protein [Maribacter dokdonensis]
MTLILKEKYIGNNNSYSLFISNRLLRLYPLYWFVLILVIVYSIFVFFDSGGTNFGKLQLYLEYFENLEFSSWVFLILTNIFIVFQDMVMFMGLDINTGELFFTDNFKETNPMLFKFLVIPQAWSVAIEISFYLIAPFLVRKKLGLILLFILFSISLKYILFQYGFTKDPWNQRFFPSELTFFLLGTISYHIYSKIKPIFLKLVFSLVIFFTLFYNKMNFDYKYFIYFISLFLSIPFIFLWSKNMRTDRYVGELSYPIYISHLFLLMIIKNHKIPIPKQEIGLGLVVFSILFSILLNELVSKRIELIRQRRVG